MDFNPGRVSYQKVGVPSIVAAVTMLAAAAVVVAEAHPHTSSASSRA
jgi:hypothetical protein